MSLINKKIVIIGGSSGIGLAVTKAVIEQEAQVVVCGRSPEKLEQTKKIIGKNVETIPVDITKQEEVVRLFKQIELFDHLVITAATNENSKRGSFLKLDSATAHRSFDKFWGYFYAAQAAVPNINPGGSITLFSGASAFKPPKHGMAVLASVNGAVATLAKALAIELAPIRVNVVSPGIVDTPVWDSMNADNRAALMTWAKESLPTQHIGQPFDIAQGVLYLMNNRYTTGTVLHIEGGLLLT
jgi:NAD(P)-dependent dehydrogenase (short-subunit alcohol dehydrogenase family)